MGKFVLRKQLISTPAFGAGFESIATNKRTRSVKPSWIIDDIIFYYQGQEATGFQRGVMIVNAATSGKDKAWLLEKLDPDQVELQDLSPESPDCGPGATSSYSTVPGSGRPDAGKSYLVI